MRGRIIRKSENDCYRSMCERIVCAVILVTSQQGKRYVALMHLSTKDFVLV